MKKTNLCSCLELNHKKFRWRDYYEMLGKAKSSFLSFI